MVWAWESGVGTGQTGAQVVLREVETEEWRRAALAKSY